LADVNQFSYNNFTAELTAKFQE